MPLTKTVASMMGAVAPSYNLPQPNVDSNLQTEQEWDYQTAQAGPNGEPLPSLAIGWRPDGTPDFGTGFKAWQNKTNYKLSTSWMKGWKEGEQKALAKKYGYSLDNLYRVMRKIKAEFPDLIKPEK